jgi:drug/metabolite transporter (DMT)-like permease
MIHDTICMSWFHDKPARTAIAALIIANIIWGATSPIFKWALEDITPFALAFLRFFLASIILLPFILRHNLAIKKHDWLKLFILSFVGIFLHIAFFLYGLTLSSSINAPIISSAAPLLLIIASIFFLKEKPNVKRIAGGILGFLGVLIIILLPLVGNGGNIDNSIAGNSLFLIATVGIVIHIILLKELTRNYSPLVLLFWSFAIASALFAPLFINELVQSRSLPNLSFQAAAGIAYGAVFASAIAYYLFHFSMKYLQASEVGLFTYIAPVVAIIVAGPLLHEALSPTYLIGALLVFIGIYIAEGKIHYHPSHHAR